MNLGMTAVRALFALYVAALAFGVGGLAVALPHPELWSASPIGASVFEMGMQQAGAVQIVLGAATMLAFGAANIGWRKTAIFFAASTSLSLGSELLGTGTGWPFGAYSYTEGLGFKIAGRVPYSVPLSWFSVGFAAYLLAAVIVRQGARMPQSWQAIALGTWLLVVWDLALDPAMASPSLPVRFWVWHQTGPYFGMPITNLVGWAATGLLFMAVSRALWGEDIAPERWLPLWPPFGVYAANMAFAMALGLDAGLWLPTVVAALAGLAPASLALRPGVRQPSKPWSAATVREPGLPH